jgi:site-specific recombinase XerD
MSSKAISLNKSSLLKSGIILDKNKVFFSFFENLNSPHTKRSYEVDLVQFRSFLRELYGNRPFIEVDRDIATAYRKFLMENYSSKKTFNRKIESVSSFYSYLLERRIIEDNPFKYIKRKSVENKVKCRCLDDEEVKKLLNIIDDSTYAGAMHKALMTFMYFSGVRISEALSLKVGDIGKKGSLYFVSYKAKGDKEMQKALSTLTIKALTHYFKMAIHFKDPHLEGDYLFRSTLKRKAPGQSIALTTWAFNKALKKYALKAGIEGGISSHSARTTVITKLWREGKRDVKGIADFVGHKDYKQTIAYIQNVDSLEESPSFDIDYNER